MLQMTDEELVVCIQSSQKTKDSSQTAQYQNELFRRHYDRVALWCLRYTGNREDALDAAQEVFLRVQRGLTNFSQEARFSTWLFTIARNYCFTELSNRKRRAEISIEADGMPPLEADCADWDSDFDQQQRLEQAKRWIAELLNEQEKQVYSLHYAQGMPLEQITRLMRLENSSGAKAYIVSARRKLSEAVRRWRVRHEVS